MDDLISRQAAIEALGERPMSWTDSDYEIAQRNQYDADLLAIETVPPADVVEVVRCKDCYFLKNNHVCLHYSKFGTIETKPDDYCSFGERKTDG